MCNEGEKKINGIVDYFKIDLVSRVHSYEVSMCCALLCLQVIILNIIIDYTIFLLHNTVMLIYLF